MIKWLKKLFKGWRIVPIKRTPQESKLKWGIKVTKVNDPNKKG